MNPIDTTAPSQTESLSFEFELHHLPEKVWRALTDPELLTDWLLPVIELKLEPGAAFVRPVPKITEAGEPGGVTWITRNFASVAKSASSRQPTPT